MTFVSTAKPPLENMEKALWFLFQKQRLWVKQEGEKIRIPENSDFGKD